MFHDAFYAVCPEVQGLVAFLVFSGEEGDEVEIVIREHDGGGADAVRFAGAVHAVVFYGYFAFAGDAVDEFPQSLLHAFAVVFYFGVVVQLFADEFVEFRAVFRGGEFFEFAGEGQQFFFGECARADHHFDEREELFVGKEFVHVEPVAFFLAAIFELRVADEFPVVCEKGFEVAYVAADAFRRDAVFRGEFFDGEVFPAQTSEEYFKQPSLFRVVHPMRPRIYRIGTLYVTDGTDGCPNKKRIGGIFDYLLLSLPIRRMTITPMTSSVTPGIICGVKSMILSGRNSSKQMYAKTARMTFPVLPNF